MNQELPVGAECGYTYRQPLPEAKGHSGTGRVEVGYVLNENGNWLPILRSGERRLVRYRETQVEKRALYQLRPQGLLANRTAWQALGPHGLTEVNQPACPHGFMGNP